MASSDIPMTDEKLRIMKDNFIMEQIQEYKSEEYSASDLSGYFGDSFKDWKKNDFEICSYNKLVQLRKVLRERGVYIDTGRTKLEVISGLMEAVKKELPWPEHSQKPVLDPSGKRKAESFAPIFPRKTQGLFSKRKTEDDLFEPSPFG